MEVIGSKRKDDGNYSPMGSGSVKRSKEGESTQLDLAQMNETLHQLLQLANTQKHANREQREQRVEYNLDPSTRTYRSVQMNTGRDDYQNKPGALINLTIGSQIDKKEEPTKHSRVRSPSPEKRHMKDNTMKYICIVVFALLILVVLAFFFVKMETVEHYAISPVLKMCGMDKRSDQLKLMLFVFRETTRSEYGVNETVTNLCTVLKGGRYFINKDTCFDIKHYKMNQNEKAAELLLETQKAHKKIDELKKEIDLCKQVKISLQNSILQKQAENIDSVLSSEERNKRINVLERENADLKKELEKIKQPIWSKNNEVSVSHDVITEEIQVFDSGDHVFDDEVIRVSDDDLSNYEDIQFID